ncbi:hypothetical protein WA1_02305 [Scytonema hofmannii PCC 7110]|uniref:Roadblock/LAMTOR2 domain-containing protein n=1 Tax=Scytonema hofmannii PCC 7110 TaxID=128403 RepID=A0A139XH26_9CYAN|nr:roadblock/LC7 domain-containing protein [Scytonema hofmannii]KYC43998.1 hypothetical protein WA1_02305 [Scytonema hofmannii PCC 7110]
MVINTNKLNTILQNFVTSVSNVQGAMIVSAQGLPLASHLPSEGAEQETVSAISATMSTVAETIATEFNQGFVEQIYVESNQGLSIVTTCSTDAMLFVVASGSNKGVLLLEIKRMIPEIKAALEGRSRGNYVA